VIASNDADFGRFVTSTRVEILIDRGDAEVDRLADPDPLPGRREQLRRMIRRDGRSLVPIRLRRSGRIGRIRLRDRCGRLRQFLASTARSERRDQNRAMNQLSSVPHASGILPP